MEFARFHVGGVVSWLHLFGVSSPFQLRERWHTHNYPRWWKHQFVAGNYQGTWAILCQDLEFFGTIVSRFV
ncbi:MAG: hypothetical protein RMK94_15305 [Armatimonadota bacterium]|nr:hypothetical protein [Armatimonadota bacterium]